MASELKVDKFTGVTTAGSISVTGEGNSTTTNLQQGLGKAWCNYVTASTFVNNDSFNVASLTDAGTGRCKIVFTNIFSNDKFASTGLSGVGYGQYSLNGQETNLADHLTYDGSNAAADSSENTMVAHGDLA